MAGTQLMRHPILEDHFTVEALAEAANVHPSLVECYVRFGLLEATVAGEIVCFEVTALPRLEKIVRLRSDLGINMAGVAVVLDLLERIQSLNRDLEQFRSGAIT